MSGGILAFIIIIIIVVGLMGCAEFEEKESKTSVNYTLVLEKKTNHPILDVGMSPNGEYIAIFSEDHTFVSYPFAEFIFMTRDGKILWNGSSYDIIAVLDNGDCVVINYHNLTILNRTGNVIWTKDIFSEIDIIDIDVSYYTGLFTVADDAGFIKLYSKLYDENCSEIWKWRTYYRPECVSISDDGRYIVASDRVWIYLFDKNGRLLWDKRLEDIFPEKPSWVLDDYVGLSFVPNNMSIVVIWGNYLGVLNVNGTWILPPKSIEIAWKSIPYAKNFAVSKNYIFTFKGNIIYVYDLKSGKMLCKFSTKRESINCIACSLDGNYIVVGSEDMWVYVFRKKTEGVGS